MQHLFLDSRPLRCRVGRIKNEHMKATSYKSPKHKLIDFFKRSRDKWRARAEAYHHEKRTCQIRIRDLEASRDHWRNRYFEDRTAMASTPSHRGNEPPPAGALARRSST